MTIQDAMHSLEDAGAFRKAAGGDQKAASLFVRAAAQMANPNGTATTSWGWLSKNPGESQVDGFAEDALCLGNDPSNLSNVYDFVGGTGAPGARILYTAGPGPRRSTNLWVAPRPLSPSELAYIGLGSGTPIPEPKPEPKPQPKKPYPGDAFFIDHVGKPLEADMALAGQTLNAGSATWFARTIWDHVAEGMTIEDSVKKHRAEWRAVLGLPPL